MELSSIQHILPENLIDFQADLFIASLSHETRSISVAKLLEGVSCRKVALCSENLLKEFAYLSNLKYLTDQGFEILELDSSNDVLDNILGEKATGEQKIMLDCTSMSPVNYFRILNWFGADLHENQARLRLVYTTAAYVEEGSAPKVKKVKDFLKVKISERRQKKMLILGLGQEPNVSEMICKIVNPDLLYLFYADPPVEKQFVEKVFVSNHSVINEAPIRNLIAYPINNGQAIYQTLIDVILPLRDEYAITIIPQGPKIFSMACMLLQMGYPDTVLSYPVFKRDHIQDRMPCGEPVVLDILFEGEE